MKHSSLDQHANENKELVPPFLMGDMGRMVELHSWSQERMPEYLWIGILRDSVSRESFFNKMWFLKEYILKNFEEDIGKFSTILKLPSEQKIELFKHIKELFGEHILDPLIVVSYFDKDLRREFYDKDNSNNDRIKKIEEVAKKIYYRYDEMAVDVRYMAIIFKLNKLRFMQGQIVIEALTKYPTTKFNDPIMEMYKLEISSLEGMSFQNDWEYSKYFYEELYLMSDCNPLIINFDKDTNRELLEDKLIEIRNLLIKSEEIKYNHKKDVIIGNLAYIYKMINEIYTSNLENSIVSRLVMRTLVEIYINLKFISLQESEKKDIWESYKDYGSGKYKNIYKKIEEEKAICPENSHLEKNLIKILANELKDEEFIKIDFKNFANKSIRQKFLDVDEKDLYDVFYDYDTCFTHGYWSAIRESALLICDNPLHNYHSVPDTNGNQKLIDISSDYVFILNKIIDVVKKELEIN